MNRRNFLSGLWKAPLLALPFSIPPLWTGLEERRPRFPVPPVMQEEVCACGENSLARGTTFIFKTGSSPPWPCREHSYYYCQWANSEEDMELISSKLCWIRSPASVRRRVC